MANNFFQTKIFHLTFYVVGIVALAFVMFGAGMSVGYHRASYAYRWGENYHRNFGGPRGGFLRPPLGMNDDLPNANGTFGRVVKVEPPIFAVTGDDGIEKSVAVATSTIIRSLRSTININDLRVGDYVVVVGKPNEAGQIEAGLIRVVPPPR
jgi:hypothetical protein